MRIDAPCNAAILHPNQAEIYVGDQNGSIHIWDLIAGEPRLKWVR